MFLENQNSIEHALASWAFDCNLSRKISIFLFLTIKWSTSVHIREFLVGERLQGGLMMVGTFQGV